MWDGIGPAPWKVSWGLFCRRTEAGGFSPVCPIQVCRARQAGDKRGP